MYCISRLKDDLYWVGGNDRRLSRFENVFSIPKGVSYNAYLVLDEQTVLIDTVDDAVRKQLVENLNHLLGERCLDYIIINHMEPDHSSSLYDILSIYPKAKVIANSKTLGMIRQFFDIDVSSRAVIVAEGDTICSGKHVFKFTMAPMVHWPEVMVTYDETDKILFSADAFGTFGAINGNIFADQVNFEHEWLFDARRYYSNIVGKYGLAVQTLLKKVEGLDIGMLCPLHGPVWRENIDWYFDKYKLWSSYIPEEKSVLIIYASIYGNTENAANILACSLAEKGVRNIAVYDVANTEQSILISECFRYSHLVFASVTYNGAVFTKMDNLLRDLAEHSFQNRTVALIENGSWGIVANRKMKELISTMKNMTILENTVTITSAVKEEQLDSLEQLAASIVCNLKTKIEGLDNL